MEAKRDENRVTTILGINSVDAESGLITPQVIVGGASSHALMVSNGSTGSYSGELVSSFVGAGGSRLGLGDNLTAQGQSFTGVSSAIGSAKFSGQQYGSPTGNTYAKIYDSVISSGSLRIPTGGALATSDAVDASDWPTSGFDSSPTYVFSGTNQITLDATKWYVIVLDYPDASGLNYIGLEITITAIAPGNLSYYQPTPGAWSTGPSNWPMNYWLYDNSNNLSQASRDENRVTTLLASSSSGDVVALLADDDGYLLVQLD